MDTFIILTVLVVDALIISWIIVLWQRHIIRIRKIHDPGTGSADIPLTNLNKLIIQTQYLLDSINQIKERQKSISPQDIRSKKLFDILEYKRKLLELDLKKLHENTDDNLYWSQVFSIEPLDSIQETGKPDEPNNESKDDLLDSLNERIATYETRIKSLEKFKENFFVVKKMVSKYQEIIDQLRDRLEHLPPIDDRSKEIHKLLDKAEQEKHELKNELERIETEFEAIFKNMENLVPGPISGKQEITAVEDNAQPNIRNGFGRVQDIVIEQVSEIESLKKIIDDLSLEVEDLPKIKKSLSDITDTNNKMGQAIEILHDEYQFLQNQIQDLLNDNLSHELTMENMMKELENNIILKQKSYNDLEKKYASMEKEYLEIYDELQQKK